mgnify:CR=1 FL=1
MREKPHGIDATSRASSKECLHGAGSGSSDGLDDRLPARLHLAGQDGDEVPPTFRRVDVGQVAPSQVARQAEGRVGFVQRAERLDARVSLGNAAFAQQVCRDVDNAWLQRMANAFAWAADNGADVISCSWGPADGRWWVPTDPRHNAVAPLPDRRGYNFDGCAPETVLERVLAPCARLVLALSGAVRRAHPGLCGRRGFPGRFRPRPRLPARGSRAGRRPASLGEVSQRRQRGGR